MPAVKIAKNRKITANGEYYFDVPGLHSARACVMEVDVTSIADTGDGTGAVVGQFNGATVTFGYIGESGNFVPYYDGAGDPIACTGPYGRSCFAPASGRPAVKVTGAGVNTSLKASALPSTQ